MPLPIFYTIKVNLYRVITEPSAVAPDPRVYSILLKDNLRFSCLPIQPFDAGIRRYRARFCSVPFAPLPIHVYPFTIYPS